MLRRLQRKIQNKKVDPLQQVHTSECLRTQTRTHTSTQKYHSQEMMANHSVGRNRTNFGSKPLLMSRSLMCKSSGPSAKLIQSPQNPAQVQPCSLLHYLSCLPNTIKPPTANKPVFKREKYKSICNLSEKKKKKVRKEEKHAERQWHWDALMHGAVLHLLYIHTVYPIPVSIFTPPWKSDTNDKIVFYEISVSLWFISFLHGFATE